MSWMYTFNALIALGGAAMICVIVVCSLMYFEKWLDNKPWHFDKRKIGRDTSESKR